MALSCQLCSTRDDSQHSLQASGEQLTTSRVISLLRTWAGRMIPLAVLAGSGSAWAAAQVRPISPAAQWGIGLVAALWLAAAVGAIVLMLRARAEGQQLRRWVSRVHRLLESAPQTYAILRPDGQLNTPDLLRSWLDLPHALTQFAALEPALAAGQFAVLDGAVRQLLDACLAFDQVVETTRGRTLLVQGRVIEDGRAVLWVSDIRDPLAIGSAHSGERTALLADLHAATAILEAAPFPIWHRDGSLALRHVNAAYVQAVGGSSVAATLAQAREISPPALADSAIRAGVAQNSPASIVVDGVRRSLQVYEVPLGADGVGGFALDITEQEQQAAALARFSQAQRDTLDMLSAPVVIFGSDQKLMFHNLAFSHLFRLAPEWLAEKPRHGAILDRMRESRLVPEQSDFARWKQSILHNYTNLLKSEEDLWHLPNETTLRVVTQPHPQGGLQLLFEDVTPRLVLERSYNTLFQVQQATLNNLHEGAAVFRADGALSLTNAALERLWHVAPGGFDSGLRVGGWLEKITPQLREPADAKMLEQAIISVIVNRRASTGTLACLDDVSLSFVGVPLPDGSTLITFLDVSDSIRIQRALQDRNEALESGDKLKSAFLENMSYQLRTPLQNILGFSEMLDQGYIGKLQAKQALYLKDILSETRKLDGLIQDVLELTVSDVGTVMLDITDVDLHLLLATLASETRNAATAKNLKVVAAIAPDIGLLRGDARRLKLALEKIIHNALEFTPPGGTITFAATAERESVAIEIADTGRGISEPDKASIFESFRKGENAKGTKGLGLGLALARHLISLHSGTIALESELGVGTRVTLHLLRSGPVAAVFDSAASISSGTTRDA